MPTRAQILTAAWTATQFLGRLAAGAFALLAIIFLARLAWAGASAGWNLAWNGPTNLLQRVAATTGADRYLKIPPPSAPANPVTDPTATLALGGPPTSVEWAEKSRELGIEAEEKRYRQKEAEVISAGFQQIERQKKALALGTPNPARAVTVAVFDASKDADKDGKPDQVAVPHTVIVDQEGEMQETSVSPNSVLNLKVGYGPVRFTVLARIDGQGLSQAKVVEFAAEETGTRNIQLLVP